MKWPDLSEQKGIVMAAVPRNPPKLPDFGGHVLPLFGAIKAARSYSGLPYSLPAS